MGKPTRYIEPMKNVILVVLFVTTMLLLYFFWGSPISGSFRIMDIIGEDQLVVPSSQAVIQPERIDVHFGEGNYTVLEEEHIDAWEQCLQLLRSLNPEEVQALEEITAEQFDRIMEYRSILYRFHYGMPLESFLKRFQLQEIPGADQVGDFSLIGFSSGSPESLFVYSKSENKYFRVVYQEPHVSMDELLTAVEEIPSVSYFRIGALVGRDDNRTLVPLSLDTSLDEVPYTPEFEDLNTGEVKAFAQTFFGESFDFVRKIEESKGTHIYMYGYGEKVLTISAEGRVEYKNKETPQGSQQNYFDALDSALQFVATHGGWQPDDSMEMSPVVQSARTVEKEKRKGYRFIFGMQLSEEPLYLEGSHSIMVEVIHGQVTQYLRDMIEVEEEEFREQTEGSERQAFSAINMIAQNYPYIASVLSEKGYDFSNLTGEVLFDVISDLIISVTTGYMKPEYEQEGDNALVPAWVVMADDVLIYFDLYDARPLGHTGLLES